MCYLNTREASLYGDSSIKEVNKELSTTSYADMTWKANTGKDSSEV